MPTVELNGRTAPGLICPPGQNEITYWSAELPGFGLRCRASGARAWVVQYRPKTGEIGKSRRPTLGDPRTVPFAKAAQEASRLLATVRLGGDPAGEARRTKSAITIRELVTRYLTHQGRRMKPRSYQELHRHLEAHIRPLHSRRANEVTQREAVELLQGIAALAPITANRVRSSLSAMFAWGMKAGLVSANPIAMTFKPAEEKPRERVLTDRELALIWSVTDGTAGYDRIVRLLLLTGARREEVAGMRWSEFTMNGDGGTVWLLPSTRTKNHLPHELSLPSMVAALLPDPRSDGDCEPRELVFGEGAGSFSGWSRCKARMDKRLADANGGNAIHAWVLHDLRRTFVTRLNDLGVEPHVIEALVNHTSGRAKAGVAGIYNRSVYATQKCAALALWCNHVSRLISEAPAEQDAQTQNVVSLRQASR